MNDSDLMKVRQAAGAAGAGNELKAAIARGLLLLDKEVRELRAQVERLTGGQSEATDAELSVLDSPRRLDALALRLEVLEHELGVGSVEVELEEAPAGPLGPGGAMGIIAEEVLGPKGPSAADIASAVERATHAPATKAVEIADPISEQRTAIAFPEPPTEKRGRSRK